MDKARDVKRGGSSRLKRQSGLDDDGFVDKLKKEKLRRLSSVGKMSLSNEIDELSISTSTSKRLKLPNKFFDDCNTVDLASIPRKLRSAMKKRGRESVAPLLPNPWKLSHTVELQAKDPAKKLKVNAQQRDSEKSPEQAIIGSISKDEEEVVETLNALAGMFLENDKADKTNLIDNLSEAKSSALPVKEDDNSKTIGRTPNTQAANSEPNLEGSARESVKEPETLNDATHRELPESKQLPVEMQGYPRVDLPTIPLFLSTGERPSRNSMVSIVPSELSLGARLKQRKHGEIPTSRRNPEIAQGLVAAFKNQDQLKHTISESKNDGSYCAEMRGRFLQSSTAKLPAWLGNATRATQTCSSDKVGLTQKNSLTVADNKKSWKKCSAHVYISRLIKVLQISEGKERLPVQPIQIKPNDKSNHGALIADKNLHRLMNCSAEKSSNEVRNAILLHKRLLQNQQQACTTSHKQSYDVLSLSGGGCGVEASNVAIESGNTMERSKQFHVPYLNSLAQNHTIMPLLLPENCYSSSSFTDYLSAAAGQQVPIQRPPPYYGSPLSGPSHLATTVLPKRQQMWGTQLTPLYSPNEVTAARFPNWQNQRHDSPTLAQAMSRPSGSSLEMLGPTYVPSSLLDVLGPKYTQITPQQQQFVPIASSMPPRRVKRQFHCLPSGYGENGGLFPRESASSLELLCNEHL